MWKKRVHLNSMLKEQGGFRVFLGRDRSVPCEIAGIHGDKACRRDKKNRAEMADSAFRTGLKTGRSKDKMTSKLSSFLLDWFPIAYKDDDTVSKTLKLFSNKYS